MRRRDDGSGLTPRVNQRNQQLIAVLSAPCELFTSAAALRIWWGCDFVLSDEGDLGMG